MQKPQIKPKLVNSSTNMNKGETKQA